jgi:GntR family transcriptional regulator
MSDLAAPGGNELAYVLVAEDIAARIASGELAPGTRLRSEHDLAAHYGRAYGTIRKAMALLRDRGLIETKHGRGTYVTASPPPPCGGG